MKIYNLEQSLKDIGKDIEQLSQDMINTAKLRLTELATATEKKIIEKASSKLKSRRSAYIEAVKHQTISAGGQDTIHMITLDKSAAWIEDGRPAMNMLQKFLASPKAKTAKDGHKYLTIPMKHNKPPSQQSAAEVRIANYVKSQLKQKGLDKTIVRDGKPVLGRAATVDLTGKGAPISKFNKPILKGLTIYQREVKMKSGKTKIARDIMTFRVASQNQEGSGLWDYPELKGVKIFDEVEKELDAIWTEMLKEL